VLRAEPKHVEALNLLGVVLGRLGRNAEAVASFDRALTAAPGSIDAWYGRGMTLVAMNRPQQAIKSFERVLAAKPDFSQVHLLRAKLLMDMGRHDAALKGLVFFRSSERIRPPSAISGRSCTARNRAGSFDLRTEDSCRRSPCAPSPSGSISRHPALNAHTTASDAL
jgi:hypothetical protein